MYLMYDLCCCAGGVSRVAETMGFKVVGIDFEPQPEYQGDFILADALHAPLSPQADLVWVSPFCQGYSKLRKFVRNIEKPRDVDALRAVAKSLGRHYVIENNSNCPDIVDGVLLCGAMFGMPLIRHRLFETSFLLPQPKHIAHPNHFYTLAGHSKGHLKDKQAVMGLEMSLDKLNQAVPAPYTRYVLTWAQLALSQKEAIIQ